MNENEFNPAREETLVQPEAEPAKASRDKRSPAEIAIAVVAVVLIAAVLIGMVAGGLGGSDPTEPGETIAATTPPDGNHDDATCKGTYTVADEVAKAEASKVVATMGGKELTNADLQIYYWMQVVTFLNEYGSSAAYMGLDYTQPLDTQMMDEQMTGEKGTWQQYFLRCALDAWNAYEALAQEAIAAGFDKENADYQEYAASLRDEVAASAKGYGYDSIEDMLASIVGPGSNEEAYLNYMQTYYLGYLYFNTLYDQLTPTAEEIEAYFDAHAEDYAEIEITKDEGVYIDVRHILIMPEGGATEDGKTTYSEEEWEEARVEAQLILDNWLMGEADEETFAELANVNSDDSDGTDGGLYTYVAPGQTVPEFNDWCFDPARQPGDYGLVKTTYGYHVMYFSASHPMWYAHAESDLLQQIADSIVPEAMAKYETTYDYTAMVLGYVNLAE